MTVTSVPIHNLEELVMNPAYKAIVQKGTFSEDLFEVYTFSTH